MNRRSINRGLLDFPLQKVVSSGICQHAGNKYTKPELWRFILQCGHKIVLPRSEIKGKYPADRKSFRCEECGKIAKGISADYLKGLKSRGDQFSKILEATLKGEITVVEAKKKINEMY